MYMYSMNKTNQCDRCFMKAKRYADLGMPRCEKSENGFHNFVSKGKAYKVWFAKLQESEVGA